MAKGANLKVNMTADNSDLVKKARESKRAVQDFEKVGSDALSKLGEAFGINTEKIELAASAIEGLGIKMKDAGGKGTQAFGALLTSVSALAAGVGAIAVGAVVAEFKALNAEAEAFKKTVEGANMEMATAAYIDTYKQVLHDANADTGRWFAGVLEWGKKTAKTFWANMGASFSTGAMFGATPGDFNNPAVVAFSDNLDEAARKARTAEEISNEIYQVVRQISDKTVDWARMEREIAEYKRVAYDKTSSTVQQQEALNNAVELIKQRYGEAAELEGRLADLMAEMNSLAASTPAEIDKANQQRVKAENVTASMNNALRELSERQAAVTANAQKEAEARQDALRAAQAIAKSRADLKAWQGIASPSNAIQSSLPTSVATKLPSPTIAKPSRDLAEEWAQEWGSHLNVAIGKLRIDANPLKNMVDVTQEMTQVLTSAFDSLGASIGSLIGDLVTGGDAWGNFSSNALATFGDMATSVGKMAISIGVAALAIQGALVSLNGWVAIAAGTALVALGAAVKAGMSNIASGNYSASASVATSGNYGSSTSVHTAFDEREINIEVSGQLYASGNQLMAVIENENNRRNHTT